MTSLETDIKAKTQLWQAAERHAFELLEAWDETRTEIAWARYNRARESAQDAWNARWQAIDAAEAARHRRMHAEAEARRRRACA